MAPTTPAPDWAQRILPLTHDFQEINATFHAIYREHHLKDPLSQRRVQLALESLLLLTARQAATPEKESTGQATAKPTTTTTLNARQRGCVESAAHYFRENLQQPMSITQLAAYHSLCATHFSKLFHRHHGVSPRTFLQDARLQHAKEQLLGGELPVKEIALQCGFVDSAHFCKTFKDATGLTPKRFRELKRQGIAIK